MIIYRITIAKLALWLCIACIGPVYAGDQDGAVIQFETGNEDRGVFRPLFEPFFDPTVGDQTSDGHMSWSWRVSYTPHKTNPKWFAPIKDQLFWVSDQSTARSSSSLQQVAFMPDETQQDKGNLERPHAGYFGYEERISLRDPLQTHSQRVDTLALTLGVVGPLSGAEAIHKISHEVVDMPSKSWNEINSEPVVNLYYERAERLFLLKSHAQENLEFMPYGGVALGNMFTYGAVGGTLRLGAHLDKDAGAHRPGPLLNGNTFAEKGDYLSWNVFMGGEGRAVARNIFLDGNTFANSLSVERNPTFYEVHGGFEFGWGATRFTVINLWRSREFSTQVKPDQLLKAQLSYSY